MPDFPKTFVVECDASSHGFGAMLIHDGHLIAFFQPPRGTTHCALATYERELIGLVHAVRHWRPYLWGRRFLVKTDHYSLKYLLDQSLATTPQHHRVGKLLGFNFTVDYKPGATNAMADALSRRDTEEGVLLALSTPRFDFIDPALVTLRKDISAGSRGAPWSVVDVMIQFARRLYIPTTSPLLEEIMVVVHEDGYEGV
jgi:hypothetical protein